MSEEGRGEESGYHAFYGRVGGYKLCNKANSNALPAKTAINVSIYTTVRSITGVSAFSKSAS